jgi:hypothetical protein
LKPKLVRCYELHENVCDFINITRAHDFCKELVTILAPIDPQIQHLKCCDITWSILDLGMQWFYRNIANAYNSNLQEGRRYV